LYGAQKGIDVLARYYGIESMRIVLDGRKVSNYAKACYDDGVAYFTIRGLKKRLVLHEFYHHLAEIFSWEMPVKIEEKEANRYARLMKRKF